MAARIPAALAAVLGALRCPVCGGPLAAGDGALVCANGHAFDVARQGYVSLLAGSAPISGDDAAMVQARSRVLDSGIYDPIRRALVEAVGGEGGAGGPGSGGAPGTVLDVGCGTGWYLAGILDALPAARGLGLDASTRALRLAARAHERGAAAAADAFGSLPLADHAFNVVTSVFAPRNIAEFARVLRPGGRLVIVRPAPAHQAELRRAVPGMVSIDPEKEDRLARSLAPSFEVVADDAVECEVPLDPAVAADLVAMAPSARHIEASVALPAAPASMTVSVRVGVYRVR